MMMMMMMMMMINCFCGMVNRRKTISLNSSRDHCQRSSPSRISDTPRAGFEPAQNLSSGLVEWSCAVVITTTPRRHNFEGHWNLVYFWSIIGLYFRKSYKTTLFKKPKEFCKNTPTFISIRSSITKKRLFIKW